MKLFLLAILFCCCSLLQAQQLTDKDIIRDRSGKVYPYEEWLSLYWSGDCEIRKGEGTEYLLVRYTPEEKKSKMESIKPPPSNCFSNGTELSPFNTTDLDGKDVDLRKLKGKVVVINFWFINCPPCRREIPELNKIVDSFEKREDVVFLALALDNKQQLQNFLACSPFNYRIIDDAGLIAGEYKVGSYPTHLILDKEGKVYFHTSGLAVSTAYWIEKSIKELLK